MQNACGEIREPMKIFYQHLKMNSAVKKIQNLEINDTTCLANGQTATLDYKISNISHVGNETKDIPSEDFQTVNWTGTGHEI